MNESGHPEYGRKFPYPAKLIARECLNGSGSVHRLVFDIGDLDYTCGDALGVYARNDVSEVDAILKILKCDGNEQITIGGIPHLLRDAMIGKFCISHIPVRFLHAFEKKLTGHDRDVFIENFCGGNKGQYSLLELLSRFPDSEINCAELCGLLKKMSPRLYSIASSKHMHGKKLHLIVGTVKYVNFLGNMRYGVASNYLNARLHVGEHADVYIAESSFKLPSDPAADIIMVGPGTGIAPFMGFIYEREYLRKSGHPVGRSWLFFGGRHRSSDFLEEGELLRFKSIGVLDNLDLAFSRDQDSKIYVQTRMLEKCDELWEWLSSGAYFYICGDAKHMAVDVENTLKTIAIESGKIRSEEVEDWLDDMRKIGRYQRDVY
jgi:sulfite reductase (NADPH) flavoprotein alpha-component